MEDVNATFGSDTGLAAGRLVARGALVPLGAACLFVLILAVFHPGLDAFGLNKDEGFNWTKARLVADGYSLYAEIWSDQPPGCSPAGALLRVGACQKPGYSCSFGRDC